MELKDTSAWSYGKTLSLADALRKQLDGSDYERGRLEEIAATVDNVAEMLITLVEALAEKDVLNADDVVRLFPGERYEIVPDDAEKDFA